MSDPGNTFDELKSTVSVRLLDPLGKSIEGLKYQIREGGKIVAKGITDSKGNVSSFMSRIGTELTLHVERFSTGEMKQVKKLVPWAEDFRVNLLSGKVKEEVRTKKHTGTPGAYKRKTHVVKKGDTLGKLGIKYSTTPQAIAKLNDMKVEAIIYEKQVLKIPPEKGGADARGANAAPRAPAPQPAREPKPTPAVAADTIKTKSVPVIGPVTTIKEEARGENGTPKSTVNLKCDHKGCIKTGDKGPMVEEINIRLMGFGLTIHPPAEFDVFTENTEKAVKQFQRDYMGVPETGKVCGAVLVGLDEFKSKFPISWNGMSCPCGKCGGWGQGFTNGTDVGLKDRPGIEYPGMHRAIIWTLRAAKFYVALMEKDLGYEYMGLSSGYRCWRRNVQTKRTSYNHMGMALDVQFKKKGVAGAISGKVLSHLKKEVFMKRMGAAGTWTNDMVSLEPISIAPRWVHFDIREFHARYLKNRFFSKTKEGCDGDDLVVMARREGRLGLVNCAGIPPRAAPASALAAAPGDGRKPFASLSLSEAGLKFIQDWEKLGPMSGDVTLPYDDSEGYCTIGYGHLMAKKSCSSLKSAGDAKYMTFEKGLTKQAALALLATDVARITRKAADFIQVPLHQYEYDALISLAFNTGGFSKFPRLVGKLNTKDYSGCCDEFADITNGGAKGLVKRRNAEMDIFRNNHYDSKH